MLERIVVINDLAYPKGGASLLAIQSARALAARGLPVTMLSGDDGPGAQADGVDHVFLGQQRLLESGSAQAMIRGVHNSDAGAMVRRWIAENDTPGTVYHLHGWSQILSPAIFRALNAVWERLVMSAHDLFLTCPNGAMYDFRQARPCARKPLSLSCIAANCDRRSYAHKLWRLGRHLALPRKLKEAPPPQLLIHGAMGPYFERGGVGDEDMIVLPNPVTPFHKGRIAAESNREVLFVGRMEGTKGAESAVQACREAGARLVAVGDGALLEPLRKAYPEVRFLGRRTHEEIGRIARTARILVMPSFYMEPFGLTAVEALWSGLPVLISGQALIAADIEHAGAGLGIDPRNISSFAAAISRLLDDDELTRRMSIAAHEQTRHLALAPAEWVDALFAIYRSLAQGGHEAVRRTARQWQAPFWINPEPQAGRTRLTACGSL